MPARVQVIVEAKDGASGILRGITTQFGAFGQVIEDVTQKNVSWGNLAASATQIVVSGMKQSIEATVEYAAQVRNLSAISGQSTEETSRFIQVLDDYHLSAEDATTATKALTKEGLAPSIDTLAKLSDEYLSLNNAQAQNEFIIKNLGRGGLEWVNVLKQGSTALREQAAAVDDSLVLTQQAVQQARDYEIALDNWQDSVQGVKVALGNVLLPVLTNVIDAINDSVTASEAMSEAGYNSANALDKNYQAALKQAEATREASLAEKALEATTKAASKSVENLSDGYKDLIKTSRTLKDANHEAMARVAYDNLIASLSIDGMTAAEEQMAEQAGIALGIVTTNSLNATKRMQDLNAQFLAGTISAQQYAAALNNIPTTVGTTITANYATTGTNAGLSTLGGGRQAGGEVYAGNMYRINEAGGEPFMPSQNGRILGHAESLHALSLGGGGGVNYFYGNVTLQIGEEAGAGLMSIR